ncbi:histidine kinase [Undibacterium seohonense]|uniref:Histidine kinase n=1 Tax=Undibacterium seohonense TaxID=1344950 RepID=A0ABR6X5K0_9BURK|nr:histidine kinase [Undibacterium seohonense]MBC3807923.1 histidine kinase [Undibacterium seohonense]
MISTTHSSLPFAFKFPNWKRPLVFLLYNLLGWGSLCVLIALAIYSEDLRNGERAQFGTIFVNWVAAALVLAPLSWILYFLSCRWEEYLNHARVVFLTYLLSFLFIIPWHVFNAAFALIWARKEIPFWDRVIAYENAVCLFRICAITAIFAAVLGLRLWQQNQKRLAALRDQREHGLRLSLALEQQNLAMLKAQLEPHFMFNSLNALSGLVRSANSESALIAIEKLSELLRYSLASGEMTWVSIEDEVQCLNDYLCLQKLRYGERLKVQIHGVDAAVLAYDCPPFLLQPLLENALRHDLECHKGESDIVFEFSLRSSGLFCCVSNPVHAGIASSPGFGLGLKTLKARLHSLYHGAATLSAGKVDQRFQVEIFLPNEY